MALYGRGFTLADNNNNGIGAPVSGAGRAGPFSREAGTLAYYEVWLQAEVYIICTSYTK